MRYIIKIKFLFFILIFGFTLFLLESAAVAQAKFADTVLSAGVRKVRDVVIYKADRFYAAFPSITKREDGELLLAFRRAPDREVVFGEKSNHHVDPNSYLVQMTSKDGVTWDEEPELMYAHPFGGSQDPCLLKLRNGKLLCTSYAWAFVRPDGIPNLKEPYFENMDGVVFLGGYLLHSTDGARTWQGPTIPPSIAPEVNYNAFGDPLPAYNRGALYEGKDSRIFWAVAALDTKSTNKTSVHLLISDDEGLTWEYSPPIAVDDKVAFNETSMYETPKGDLVAFLRSEGLGGEACITRSTDGGKTFQKWEGMGFHGRPLHALKLPDNRVLLTYGYREKPYGVRARILNPECTDFAMAPEIVLRDDGGTSDLGYPWSVQLDEKRVLVVYYFNIGDGLRHIAGTILEIN